MHRERQETKRWLDCDGCQYTLGAEAEAGMTTLTLNSLHDGGEPVTFHFHGVHHTSSHDCFRYWAHSPNVMKRSLKERGWDQEDIDDFMAVMLYRDESKPYGPGVARAKA